MKKHALATLAAAGLAAILSGAAPARADAYAVALGQPNGYHVPAIIGATGSIDDTLGFSGYDYFHWYGINYHRYWISTGFSRLNWGGGVAFQQGFQLAVASIRADPNRQGTAKDAFIDWAAFNQEITPTIRRHVEKMLQLGITPMLMNESRFSDAPLILWGDKFEFWKHWYAFVYFFASRYGIVTYQFCNEPHFQLAYPAWQSQWLIAADAMRKAIADVNRNGNKHLSLIISGPTETGTSWNYALPDPAVDFHGWGSVSWKDIHTDVAGNQDGTVMNYGVYDFHRYINDGQRSNDEIAALRKGIATAKNSPSQDIPLTISEYNTGTGAFLTTKNRDNEDMNFGIGLAQILQATAVLGPDGLGDQGGFFLFKLGSPMVDSLLVNRTSYVSPVAPFNYGGITRGGACFQMYARHFRGGKPLLALTETGGSDPKRRSVAVWDQAAGAYYFFSSNLSGSDAQATLDLGALNVSPGAIATVQRVDRGNVGQITETPAIDAGKKLSFAFPDTSAVLVVIPVGAAKAMRSIDASEHSYLDIGAPAAHGSDSVLKVSLHHSDAGKRRLGFLKFAPGPLAADERALLRLCGRNSGAEADQREILHVYGAEGGTWTGANLGWDNAPGLGDYHQDGGRLGRTDGLGPMVEIEDNFAGTTPGKGLGVTGTFLGQTSFSSPGYACTYLDVSDFLKNAPTVAGGSVTLMVARTVRYNVNQYYSAPYYRQGVYDYDTRSVDIASPDHPVDSLQPKLLIQKGDALGILPGKGSVSRQAPQLLLAYDGYSSRGSVHFRLSENLPAGAALNVVILTPLGEKVRSLSPAQNRAGDGGADLLWDERGDNGRRMRPGIYLYQATLRQSAGAQVFHGHLAIM